MRAAIAVTALLFAGCASELMQSARHDLVAGNARRAVGTLDVELRRDAAGSSARDLMHEAGAAWAKSELAAAHPQGPVYEFGVARWLASELTRRGLSDVVAKEVTPQLVATLPAAWDKVIEGRKFHLEEVVGKGEAMLEFLPPDVPQRARLAELRAEVKLKHAQLLAEVRADLPGALLLHIRLARLFGVQWATAREDEARVIADSNPAWKPVEISPGTCGALAGVLDLKLKTSPFGIGHGPEATISVDFNLCPSNVSRTWTTHESMPYVKATTVDKVREDRSYKVEREGNYDVTYEVTKRTPYTQTSYEFKNEYVEVTHVSSEASANGRVTIRCAGKEITRDFNVKHTGESMAWQGQFVDAGRFDVPMGAPLTSLAALVYAEIGNAMSASNKELAAATEERGLALLDSSKFEGENLLMLAGLMGRTFYGENREIRFATRDYLYHRYDLGLSTVRTVMLDDPPQKPTVDDSYDFGFKPVDPEPDEFAVRRQRAIDNG